jgi:phosphate-selective porin OprO and OprP
MRSPFASIGVALLGLLIVSSPVRAQDPGEEDDASVVRWRNRPSFQFGDVRLDVRFKVARDWRHFETEVGATDQIWRMRRGGINGEIGDHIEFQIERDLFRGGEWRDLFARWRTHRQVEVTAGRFKVPFGREQSVSASDIDFAFRALVSDLIAPGRDKGVMVNGRFLSRGVTYEVGVFDDDGDNGRLREDQFSVTGDVEDIGPSFAGRVTGTPLRRLTEHLETFRVGFAYGGASLPEGLNSLRGRTLYGTSDFFEPVYVNGRRTRMGVELSYTPGPVSVTAEWMQAREERKRQGLGDLDLSDLITTGWYTAATWLVTGEDKSDFNNPRDPLFDGGFGAIELAMRYERLGFESADKVGPAFSNPRAEHVLGNTAGLWTMGVNWFANRWVRATINAIREDFDDLARAPQPGTGSYWSAVGRLQLVF